MDSALLSLPWQIQLSLASGYAAYALAFSGIRSHHQAADIAFRTLLFSAVTTVIFQFCIYLCLPDVLSGIISVIITILSAVIWRKYGRKGADFINRKMSFSSSDDELSAYSKVFSDNDHYATQIIVQLNDGSELHCRDLSQFKTAAITPFTLGQDGSVAMYVTHSVKADANGDEEETHSQVRDPSWGDQITLVPATNVKMVKIRFLSKKSTS